MNQENGPLGKMKSNAKVLLVVSFAHKRTIKTGSQDMKVNEINVLRKCREIRRRITSI